MQHFGPTLKINRLHCFSVSLHWSPKPNNSLYKMHESKIIRQNVLVKDQTVGYSCLVSSTL